MGSTLPADPEAPFEPEEYTPASEHISMSTTRASVGMLIGLLTMAGPAAAQCVPYRSAGGSGAGAGPGPGRGATGTSRAGRGAAPGSAGSRSEHAGIRDGQGVARRHGAAG